VQTALAHLSPDALLLWFTVGVLLIYAELNRPGWIFPGFLGLLIALLAVSPLAHERLNPVAVLLILAAVGLIARGLRRSVPLWLHLVATICLIGGFLFLISDPQVPPIRAVVAVPCGLVLGLGTSVLTRIARRARLNKGLD
jgi:membrane-bound serine protease (ClpP class)